VLRISLGLLLIETKTEISKIPYADPETYPNASSNLERAGRKQNLGRLNLCILSSYWSTFNRLIIITSPLTPNLKGSRFYKISTKIQVFLYIIFRPFYTRFSNRKTYSYSSYSTPSYLKLQKYILNLPHRPSPRNSSQIPSPASYGYRKSSPGNGQPGNFPS
jgi:hypothetical protein